MAGAGMAGEKQVLNAEKEAIRRSHEEKETRPAVAVASCQHQNQDVAISNVKK